MIIYNWHNSDMYFHNNVSFFLINIMEKLIFMICLKVNKRLEIQWRVQLEMSAPKNSGNYSPDVQMIIKR